MKTEKTQTRIFITQFLGAEHFSDLVPNGAYLQTQMYSEAESHSGS